MNRFEMLTESRNMITDVFASLEPDDDRVIHTPLTAYTLLLAERAVNFRERAIENVCLDPETRERKATHEFMMFYTAKYRTGQMVDRVDGAEPKTAEDMAAETISLCMYGINCIARLTSLEDSAPLAHVLSVNLTNLSDVKDRLSEIRTYANAVRDFSEEESSVPDDLKEQIQEARAFYLYLYTALVMLRPDCGRCDSVFLK